MKIIRSTPKPNGVTRLIIELAADEELVYKKRGCKVVHINPDKHYALGEPMHDDVISGHILAEAKPVYWCSLSQEWIKA